ncbi:LAFE_0G05776g1_1 [Lachancea fermentati]|uniref:LAFE_0G05776g1_1 n=1 Tax=Lachancea fermentati TaxID=4955 RepID=A0A1G4MHE9_LACFM|nr:LAFE_0G05776g1_1 [Lachancea fermentati]
MGTKGIEMGIWNSLVSSRRWRTSEKNQSEKLDLEKQQVDVCRRPSRRRWQSFFTLLTVFLTLVLTLTCTDWLPDSKLLGLTRCGSWKPQEKGVTKSFEITVEKLPEVEPLYSQKLLKHSFGDSWGKPAVVEFEPYKDASYNKIILELVTRVSGRQFDRLLHVFLDDINVWRSSTVEPTGDDNVVVSESIKDVSQYLSLFDKESIELKFQLDNLVTPKLNGVFEVELTLHYYQEAKPGNGKEDTLREELLSYFTSPPTFIAPLVKKFIRTPLLYYPLSSQENPRWTRELPELEDPTDISRVILEVFASGNAAEEFWYTNVLDRYTNRFHDNGHQLLGHGPLRVLKAYLTNSDTELLVDSVVPTPVIFTGGISPALWRPCVGMNAFDIESYKIDLTPFLPLLAEGAWELQLEVVSSVDTHYKPTVGENWILSGNLMIWKKTYKGVEIEPTVFSNSSELETIFQVDVDDGNPEQLFQNVIAKTGVLIDSIIKINGQTYNFTRSIESSFKTNQTYLENGDIERSVIELEKVRRSLIHANDSILFDYIDKTLWDFVGDVQTLDVDEEKSELTYKAAIVRSLGRYTALQHGEGKSDKSNTDVLLSLSGSQVGEATYTLSPNGNHGSGDTFHNVLVDRSWPHEERYKRSVLVRDNKVVLDIYNRD